MEKSHSASYAAAGVNIEAGYEGVRLMKKHLQRTHFRRKLFIFGKPAPQTLPRYCTTQGTGAQTDRNCHQSTVWST